MNRSIGTNDFTNLDDSLDTENCCRQVLEALTPSDDHIQQQIQQTFTSQNTNKNNQGNHIFYFLQYITLCALEYFYRETTH